MEGIEIKGIIYLVLSGAYICTIIGIAIYIYVQERNERKRQIRENEK